MTTDVRVNINGEGWTVNKIQFTYFANTAAKNCLAYGPGLLPTVSITAAQLCLIAYSAVIDCSLPAFTVAADS